MKEMMIAVLAALVFSGCQSGPIQGVDSTAKVSPGISEMSPAEARPAVEAAYSQLVDVRTPEEYASGHANRARNIPLDTLEANLDKIEKNEPVYLICQTDNRSRQAAKILAANGFGKVVVITGGTIAWRSAGLPMGDEAPATLSTKLDERTAKALLSALEDERRAAATYEAVLAKFPGARPFENIVEAEKEHQALLLQLFTKYAVKVPKNEFVASSIAVPDTLSEACKAGIKGEEENITLYDGFFEFTKEADIKAVFERLQAASRDNHLPAFTRCAAGGGAGPGSGKGLGGGRPNL